jgi:hypothetical protein
LFSLAKDSQALTRLISVLLAAVLKRSNPRIKIKESLLWRTSFEVVLHQFRFYKFLLNYLHRKVV